MVEGRNAGHCWGVVLDASDVRRLGLFYRDLVGWEIFRDEPDDMIIKPTRGQGLPVVPAAARS